MSRGLAPLRACTPLSEGALKPPWTSPELHRQRQNPADAGLCAAERPEAQSHYALQSPPGVRGAEAGALGKETGQHRGAASPALVQDYMFLWKRRVSLRKTKKDWREKATCGDCREQYDVSVRKEDKWVVK
ncbi:hypothetical protein NDU88_005368 [Pleurodeles waltl]|uniref:Uncharacterized protein n=1 Tax=Pleurodeles waltl TaxID=8319 RepID=A0AAV7LKX9_PLEWA|nr:hypothetical protein NDU88_005368 [Pleurodeles waltl]